MSEGSLVVIKKNGSEGSKYPMEKENKYILGPGADCHLRFNVEDYKQNICEISTNKKLATITKLSSCPILLNNNEIKTPKSLKYGDVIKIGSKTFKWSSLIRRESFTRNVFKNSASKSKRRSSLSDFRGSGLNKLNTWRETDENVQITSSEHQNVKRMSSSSTKSTKIEQKSSGKSKTVPKNYGTLNKTPKALAVVKSLDFRTRSAGKKMSPAKKKYFDPNNKTSKIPRIFFPDHTNIPKLSKPLNKSPKTKTFEEFKENLKTPTTELKKRKSARISLELNSNAQIALTEANVRTPDSLGVKPETPNIKLVKSVNKKNASLKKSLDNITMAKKRKISNVTTEDSFVSKKFKLDENEESLIQDETMGSLFDSSLSFLESSNSSRRSNRNSLPIVSSPISPKQFELHNVSGIKSFSRTPNMKSPVNFNSAVKLSAKTRQSLQLNSLKNEVVKRRFTESNLISSHTPENEIRIIKPIFSTPKAQNSTFDLLIEEKVRKSVGRPVKNPKISSLIKATKVKRSPGRPRRSGIKTVLKSPNNISNVSGRKSMLRTSASPLISPKNKSIKKVIVTSTPDKQSPARPRKSEIKPVLKSPKNIANVSGRKSMLSTPSSPLTSPKNKSIQEVILKSTPGKQSPGRSRKSEINTVLQSPKNYALNVSGRKSLLSTPGSPLFSPKNKSIQEVIVKSTPGKQSPGRLRKSEIETVLQSPKNYILNVSGRKSMLSAPSSPLTSPKNKSIQEIIVKSTPGKQSPKRNRKSEITVLQSPENYVLNVSGRKSLLSTPGSPLTSPKNKSIQEIIVKSTPGKQSPSRPRKSEIETVSQSPKNYNLNISGRKSILRTPGSPLISPKNKSIQEIIVKSTPGKQSPNRPRKSEIETVLQSPKNYNLNISGRKSILRTPGSPLTSPKNKSIQEVIVKSTPGKQSPGRPRKSEIETVLQSPKNYNLNISGRKSILRTPGSPLTSPKNKSIQEVIVKSTPGKQSPNRPRKTEIETVLQSPKNYNLNISGRKSILRTPGSPLTSPKNKSIQEVIVKSTPGKQSPNRPRKSEIETVLQSPKNYNLNISGRKSILRTPGSPLTSPKNKSIQEVIVKSTPGKQSPGRPRKSEIETVLQSPKNYNLNISGRKSILRTPGSPMTSPKNKSIQEVIVKSTPGKQGPRRVRKSEITVLQSPENYVLNVSGRKSLLSTPGSPLKSPKNKSVKKIIVKKTRGRSKTPKKNQGRPPKSPKNDLTDVAGVKKLLKTPGRPPKSPKNDLTNIAGVKKLLKTPGRPPKSPRNDLTNIAGVKKLLGTPGHPPKSPKNDLTNIAGVKKLLKTPGRPPKSPRNDLTNITGVKKLLGTPGRAPKSPKNDLTNIAGVKKLLRSPGRPPKSPKNDLTNIAGVKQLLRTPGRPQKSPKNDLTNVRGVKNLLRSPGRLRNSPKNDLSNVSGVRNLLRSPGRPPKSPKNELSNISGIKLMFELAEIQNSPKNELKNNSPVKSIMKTPKKLSNVSGSKSTVSTPQNTSAIKNDPGSVKNLHKTPERKSKTPRKQNQPKNDLSDVEGVASLFNTSKLNSPTNNMDSVFDHLKDENNDTLNLSFIINSKSPLRTYERKVRSLSPEKPKLFESRKSLREIPEDSKKKESVQKWLNEYVLSKEKSPENNSIPIAKKSSRTSEELPSKNKRLALKTNDITPSSPKTRSRRLKKVENEENIAPNKILTPKNKNLETDNLIPSSPTTRSRRLKKVENEENITPVQEKIVPQCPKLNKTRRTRKNIKETEAPTQKVTRRGRNAAKTTDEIVETVPKGRTTRKRTKKDEQTTENVETTEVVAAKRPRKNENVRQVQFEVSENEEKKEIPKNKRGGSRKNLNEEIKEHTSPVRSTRARGRKAQIIEETETTEELVEKKTTTRSRRGKNIEEIKDDSVVEEATKEPAKKATRNARSKKNEETAEETKEVPTKRTTRKKIAENEELPLDKETKTTTRRRGRQKKEVEPEKELEETRPTRGKRQKNENESKDDEIREPEVKTRSTRGKKKNVEETTEPVKKITRSRRK